MSQTRYCSTCGTLLSQEAVICGECGARYQASPYERRATDAPGAWSRAPKPRSRNLGQESTTSSEEEGVELITRESLEPKNPSATTLRSREQYDQMMVTQPPMQQNEYGSASGAPSGPGSPAVAPDAPAPGQAMEPPLDGCSPASPVKRLLAALVDAVIATLVVVPQIIGWVLLVTSEEIGVLPFILIGVGVALPLAYTLLIIWLSGSKGFTVGKLIFGLRITRGAEGGPIGFLRAAGRWLLFGIVWPIMALSIFLDPKKHLRGFHDRAVDSVVVDLKAGRDPMKPRPDDFERAGADHYLGAPSVAVSTHENLLAEPGAAWKDPAEPAPAQGGQEAAGWGGAPQAASPYAPPSSGSSAASATDAPMPGAAWGSAPPQDPAASQSAGGGWAPPPIDPIPPQPQAWDQPPSAPEAPQQQSWDQPPSAPEAPQQGAWGSGPSAPEAPQQGAWGQPDPASQQSWGGPSAGPAEPSWQEPAPQAPPAAPQQSWDQPPSAPEAPQAGAAQGWAPPSAPSDPAPAPSAPSGQDPAAPYAQPSPAPYGQGPEAEPSDLTGSAWDGEDDGVDEQTRLTVADDPLGDLEQTRISAVQLPAVKKLRLRTDDGAERIIEKAVVIGRNPSAPGEEVLFVMKDDTRSVSKTHLRLDGTGDEVTVTDLGSTNGSSILREDGSRENLVPNSPTVLPSGAQVTLGDRTVSVERMQ